MIATSIPLFATLVRVVIISLSKIRYGVIIWTYFFAWFRKLSGADQEIRH